MTSSCRPAVRQQLKLALEPSSVLPTGPSSTPPATARGAQVRVLDKAHRSQYDFVDGFARHVRDALPNALVHRLHRHQQPCMRRVRDRCRLCDDPDRQSDSCKGEAPRGMARRRSGQRDGAETKPDGGATRHEAEPWVMADTLRGGMDAAGYRHPRARLGLPDVHLRRLPGAPATVHAEFEEDAAEDREDCTTEKIVRVPPQARCAHLEAQARQSTIGLSLDQAMAAIERVSGRLRLQSS